MKSSLKRPLKFLMRLLSSSLLRAAIEVAVCSKYSFVVITSPFFVLRRPAFRCANNFDFDRIRGRLFYRNWAAVLSVLKSGKEMGKILYVIGARSDKFLI